MMMSKDKLSSDKHFLYQSFVTRWKREK